MTSLTVTDDRWYTQPAPLFFQKDIIGTYYWYTVCSLEKSHTKAAWKMIFLWSREDGRPSNSSDIPPNMAGSIVKHMKSQCPMVRISLNSRQITMIPWDFSRRPHGLFLGGQMVAALQVGSSVSTSATVEALMLGIVLGTAPWCLDP